MHDAVLAEHTGIPATAIVTDHFVHTARVMAQVVGRPDYPLAVIAHPIAHNDAVTLHHKAAEAVRQCLAILVQH